MRNLLLSIWLLLALFPFDNSVAEDCKTGLTLTHTFDSGASWSFCAVIDDSHALELQSLRYHAPGDTSRQVLEHIHLGQLLLHYHDEPTANALIGSSTFSASNRLTLSEANCVGDLHTVIGQPNVLCSEVNDTGLLAKYNLRRGLQGQLYKIFSVSRYNDLTFQIAYGLSEDGRINPSVSMSGRSNKTTDNTDFGVELVEPVNNRKIIGTQATLLYTWRMVSGLNGDGTDDTVEELNFVINPDDGNRRPMRVDALSTETLRNTERDSFRGWRIKDSNGSGYYLDPQKSGFSYHDNKNNWAQFDFAVTAFNPCQIHTRLVTAPSSIQGENNCMGSLDNFVDGESVDGRQPVLWYSQTQLFRPSPEDYPVISSVLTEFELLPFDWTAASPFEVIRE